MTTKVAIVNFGPDAVKVASVSGGKEQNEEIVQPGSCSRNTYYVHSGTTFKVSEVAKAGKTHEELAKKV